MPKRLFAVLSTLILRGLGSGISVIFTILVSRYLETSSAAHFFFLFNISTIAAVCFRWGLDEVIVRRVAAAPENEIDDIANGVIGLAHRRILIWGILAILAMAVSVNSLDQELLHGIGLFEGYVVIFSAVMIALVACAARIKQGLGYTNFATFLLNIAVPLFSLITMLGFLFSSITIDSNKLILIYAVISGICYLFVVFRHYGNPVKILIRVRKHVLNNTRKDVYAANKLGVVVLAQQALIWTALLIIPLMYGSEQYKGFVVAQKLSMLISLLMLAVNFTFSSRFASLHAAGELVELRRIVSYSAGAILVASIGVFFIVFIAKDFILQYAKIDTEMTNVLMILLGSQILFSLAALFSVVLSMCRDDNYLLFSQSVTNTLGVIAFIAVSHSFSIESACMVFFVSYFALSLLLGVRAYLLTEKSRSEVSKL